MEKINFDDYEMEIVQDIDDQYDEMVNRLLMILNDRTIPEESKHLVREQFIEIMKMKMINMNPPKVILSKK